MASVQIVVTVFAFLALLGHSEASQMGVDGVPSREEIEAAFNIVDTEGSGRININQVKELMLSLDKFGSLTDVNTDVMVEVAMGVADTDEDGMLSLVEIFEAISATDPTSAKKDATIAAVFNVFDKDGSGGLNEQEMIKVDKMMGGGSGDVMGMMITMLDQDGDKELNLQELKIMMD